MLPYRVICSLCHIRPGSSGLPRLRSQPARTPKTRREPKVSRKWMFATPGASGGWREVEACHENSPDRHNGLLM